MTATAFVCDANMFRTGDLADIPPSDCSLCGHKTLFTDFCGAMCHTCGRDIEATNEQIINFQRTRAKLTIGQLSEATGYSIAQIAAFEEKEQPVCPDYYAAFCRVIKEHYSKPRPVEQVELLESAEVGIAEFLNSES